MATFWATLSKNLATFVSTFWQHWKRPKFTKCLIPLRRWKQSGQVMTSLAQKMMGMPNWKPWKQKINKSGSETNYSGDLHTNQLNTGNFWIPNFPKFGFQMVWYSNGRSMGYVLCTRPTIWIPDQYIINKIASICMVFKWLGRPVFISPLYTSLKQVNITV